MAKLKADLTQGSIIRSLTRLAIPIILANLLQTAYNLIDTFWVGRLGADAVAAVSVSFPVIFLIISMGGGLTMAGTIMIAQFKGEKNDDALVHITTQTMVLVFVLAIILTFIGFSVAGSVLKFINVEEIIFQDALGYLRISFLGLIFIFIYMLFQSMMRGIGEVKIPMYIVLFSVLFNLVLDPLFIFGKGFIPAMGVKGAALASLVTQFISTIIAIILLLKGNYGLKFSLKKYFPDFNLFRRILKIGLPSSLEMSMRALGMLAMTYLVAKFGTQTLATYGIGIRVFSFVIIPTLGLSLATTTLVGQNIGAGKLDRAVKVAKISALIGFVSLTLLGVVFNLYATQISAFFVPDDISTIETSAEFIKILTYGFGFLAVIQVLNGTFRGAGDTLIAMFISMISIWVLRFPIAYYLSQYTSLKEIGLWVSFPADMIIGFILANIWFFRGSWKHKKVTENLKMVEKANEETIAEEGIGS